MEKVTGKEGKGAEGTGFDGEGQSNSYSQLPASSNRSFGIEDSVSAGYSEAAATPNTKGQNVGNTTRDTDGDTMGMAKKFNVDADIIEGTVQGGIQGVNEKRRPGSFGVSAKSGNPPATLNEDSYYGSGSRKAGTAAQFGEPGRGGSMALAAKGLSGNTGGSTVPTQDTGGSAPKATLQSRKMAAQGMGGSGGAGNNDRS